MPRPKPPSPPGRPSKPPAGLRLQRVMADAGVASRRECEQMIERGMVEVNGAPVTRLPVFVNPSTDRITVDGRPIDVRPAPANRARAGRDDRHVYVMLHKPDRVLTTTRDGPADGGDARRTVLDLVDHRSGARLYPVGRLDYHSTGLVLLTNDGELADRLTHARYGVTRTYRVTIRGHIREDILDDLRRRVGVPDAPVPAETRPADARSAEPRTEGARDGVRIARRPASEGQSDSTPTTMLEITLREGKSRQLAAILEQMGCIVRKLTRIGIGPLRLRGLPIGEWRDLSPDEVRELMIAGGLIAPPAHASRAAAASAAPTRPGKPRRIPRGAVGGRTWGGGDRGAPAHRGPGGKGGRPGGGRSGKGSRPAGGGGGGARPGAKGGKTKPAPRRPRP